MTGSRDDGVKRVEVGIVGAGVHGASTAFHLASRGVEVAVFERGRPASGPTGRSSAVCRAYYTNPFLARVARESLDMFAHWERLVGGDAGFRRLGALFLHGPDDESHVREAVHRLDAIGTVCDVLAPGDIAKRFPQFDLSGVAVGVWEHGAGYADPAGTTDSLFRAAVERGAAARLGTRIDRIEPDDEGGVALFADDGTVFRCRRLLIAAGPWTKGLALRAGLDVPLTVERHVVATFGWGGAPPVPMHADIPNGYYFRPEGADLFLVGPLHEEPQVDPDDFSERLGEDEARELSDAVVRRVPALEVAEAQGGWASLYDVSPDWQPVIGEIAPGIFVDAGTSGHGFKLAPALGRHVAALVMGEEVKGLEQFHPDRFARAHGLAAGYGDARILG
jgi:glycine/D-amino acid oxidase-like deaminating enzyme